MSGRSRSRIWLPKRHVRVLKALRVQNQCVNMDRAILKTEQEIRTKEPFLRVINQRCLGQIKKSDQKVRKGNRKAKIKVFLAESDDVDDEVDDTNKLCYLAPSLSLESFDRILDELSIDFRGHSNAVVGGDFNAWAIEWGSSRTNARGRAVETATAVSVGQARKASYRPICLLDIIGKVFEMVIATRMTEAIEAAGSLSPEQYGFRKGRSTIDAIVKVVKVAREAITGSRNAFNTADWGRTLESQRMFNIPSYLLNIALSYFSNRVLTMDTCLGSRAYKVLARVPQGSVLGPLLWNAMYDGVLRLPMPVGTSLVGFADDVAIVVVAKELATVEAHADAAVQAVESWLANAGLQLAAHKTEAVLVSSRKAVETASVSVGETMIRSQRAIQYLGVLLDTRLCFKEHLDFVHKKASGTAGALSRMLLNTRGPKQATRKLLTTVVTSQMLYAAPVWAEAAKASCAVRIACAFIAGQVPELIQERAENYAVAQDREATLQTRAESKVTAKRRSFENWQNRWDSSQKDAGRTRSSRTYRARYLKRFGHETEDCCPEFGSGVVEDAQHVLFECHRFDHERHELEAVAGSRILVVLMMLADQRVWEAPATFAAEVMKSLRELERRRKEQTE
nr:uncharacterized protein LOC121502027 [Drosophila kikkawai]